MIFFHEFTFLSYEGEKLFLIKRKVRVNKQSWGDLTFEYWGRHEWDSISRLEINNVSSRGQQTHFVVKHHISWTCFLFQIEYLNTYWKLTLSEIKFLKVECIILENNHIITLRWWLYPLTYQFAMKATIEGKMRRFIWQNNWCN